ncbi:MAG: hypothetical protein E7350_03615 [Clostridiales bacterium]|nr:hypothetical protein [Clostridiales bacterium]
MFIPKLLEEISKIVEASKNIEVAKIKCKCNHNHFMVYEFCESYNANVKPGFNEIIRENNKLYLVKRNFFGKIVEKIECGNRFDKKQRRIIKVKCEKCGLEYIVFDNYKHGYDAVITRQESCTLKDEKYLDFKKVYSQPIEVYVKIRQDFSYAQFMDEFENIDYVSYLNSFGNIDIYGINSKSRKIKICTEETA